ncbi:helix-turn-helix domain-containing protein [Ureibacillus thermophilus]|uniref:XRE family transcriptional regulator n=1 Tax=Ureibacillus thermophilus TaxID=367743 RepID=A0A4P6UR09_9BACL|nr:helix-turn-helix transcriptional regulator [Ureibacillus thermophilus]QBK24481.1 XRE family transcriptional regulator [Ureibacillus thermophilus]
MILAEKIMEERKRNGWSQEELAEKLGVSRQSVSKWESAQSVPDLNRIIKMAELFGVTTDYLLKDEMEKRETTETLMEVAELPVKIHKVSMEEATEFIKLQEKHAPLIAFGVSLCILSPVILLLLAGLADSKMMNISNQIVGGIGISVLLIMIAVGVYIFIKCSNEGEKFEYLDKEAIETEYGVSGMVREKKNAYNGKFNLFVLIGVILCILSPLPLIISGFLTDAAYIITSMVALLLVIVAAAVNMFIRVGMIRESYEKLLQEGEYTVEKKKSSIIIGRVSGAYWCVVVAVYLAWSFIGMNWDKTWIVWPIAGVLYGAFISIVKLVIKAEE